MNSSKNQKLFDNNSNFIYGLTKERLTQQLLQIDALDNKNISLLGFSCTLIAILSAALAIIPVTATEIVCSYVFIGISVLIFILIVILSLKSYFAKAWQVGPDIGEAWKHSKKYEKEKMLRWAARSFSRAYYKNKKPIQRKLFASRFNTISLIFQIGFEVLAITLISIF